MAENKNPEPADSGPDVDSQVDVVEQDKPLRISPAPITKFGETGVPPGLKNSAGIIWRILLILVGLFVLVKAISYMGGVAMALFFAGIVAALGLPICNILSRYIPRALASIITLLFMIVVATTVLGLVAKSLVDEAENLGQALQTGLGQIEEWLKTGPFHMDDAGVASLVAEAQHWLANEGGNFAKNLPSTLGSFGDFITAASVFLFGSFFFLSSGGKIWSWFMSWVPDHVREEIDNCGRVAWISLSGYTRGLILIAIADGILVYIGLVILGIPMAPALAVVVMFGALIPVIGAPVATMFAAVVALASHGLVSALLVVGLTIIVGSFDGDIMQPLIMGHAVQLHPLGIVSAIAFGTLTFGIIGALLAVPLTATIYSVAKYLSGRSLGPKDENYDSRKPRLPSVFRRFSRKKHVQDVDAAPATS